MNNLNPLFEGGISRSIMNKEINMPGWAERDPISKGIDFLRTGHFNPRKVAAVNLKRMRRKDPEQARRLFKWASVKQNEALPRPVQFRVVHDLLPLSPAGDY